MDTYLNRLGINKKVLKHTRATTKKVKYDHVRDLVPQKEGMNFQMDYLELPKTKYGYDRLLVMVDLGTGECDFQPTSGKTADKTLNAMMQIFKRPYLNKPFASIRTDGGSEFKGAVKDWLYNESILLRQGISGRHKQTGSVESLNRQITHFIFAYLNTKEMETGKTYRYWLPILPELREILNEMRVKSRRKQNKTREREDVEITDIEAKYDIGDKVYRKLDVPQDTLGNKHIGSFRTGDVRYEMKAREIMKVLYYPNNVRYMLKGLPNVSFTQDEVIPEQK